MNVPSTFTSSERAELFRLYDALSSNYGLVEGDEVYYVRAPGRTEIAGNHTDHEGGRVIGAAVNAYVRGVVSPNGLNVIRLISEGHSDSEVSLADLEPREEEFGNSASIVKGLAGTFKERGFSPAGFDAYLASDVPTGSGLSSSAAFELAVASAMNVLWAKGVLSPEDLAIMSQAAENRWFGKPCGLLDQASSALGSLQYMNFAVQGKLEAETIDFDFSEAGYSICLVAVGADHAALTSEYAAVPGEMQAVARLLGKERLGDLPEEEVLSRYSVLREKLGDRPVIRALHYYREDKLTAKRAEALKAGDMERFLELTRLSGASSAMYLQNVSVHGADAQPSMAALALADELIGETGAVRIHGGGFGGTIQAYVRNENVKAFASCMDAAFGSGACGVYQIDHEGARAWRL